MSEKGILTIISGFSGVGKGTLVNKLLAQHDNYALSVSATTRDKRDGEVDGKSYFFMTTSEFEEKIEKQQFLEYARYVDHYYGTPRQYVEDRLKEGKDVLLEIEIQGTRQVKKLMPEAVTIFVMPPNAGTLKERLIGRNTESEEVIKKRLKRAVQEAEGIEEYDYVLVNDRLGESVERLHALIQSSHGQTYRNIDFIKQIREDVKIFMEGE